MKRWRSNALCPPGPIINPYRLDDYTTTDTHDTKEQAEAVCRRLESEGLGGERLHFPIKTWVEEIVEQEKR